MGVCLESVFPIDFDVEGRSVGSLVIVSASESFSISLANLLCGADFGLKSKIEITRWQESRKIYSE